MHDVSDLRSTIIPKSDQLNAEQLLSGSITITVSDVRVSANDEQPVVVHYEGENGRPFKPCKTMRKLLVFAWGEDGRQWAGRSMTLYQDPNVKFGGDQVGGIRISHMTDLANPRIEVRLTTTRGKKSLYTVQRLESADAKACADMKAAGTAELLKSVFAAAYTATKDAQRRERLQSAYNKRKAEIEAAVTNVNPESPEAPQQ